MDSRIECTLKKIADDTKLSGVVNMLEGRDAIQRDLDRLERWACGNNMKLNNAKCKVLHMSQGNPKHKYRLSGKGIESNPQEKDLGVSVAPTWQGEQLVKVHSLSLKIATMPEDRKAARELPYAERALEGFVKTTDGYNIPSVVIKLEKLACY
ncbi:rna-directed dna polymerase from mobile element jockey-like [Limosa lapponica baueri]|uniref:Rna-directed dna polymerase from mobile element jockey-like n=1 Tax=Limosa lapponica baueri TaxID=1758121 RepID=A0A2I0UIC1_LIMLA|nr:rna-directed dna polymerase from mobile element jockey-like [Limosa lapponica baueri]